VKTPRAPVGKRRTAIGIEIRGTSGRLGSGGRARRDTAENHDGNHGDYGRNFETIDGRDQGKYERRGGDGDACGGADGAGVGIHCGGVQVHTAMQLRREEYAREEEGQEVNAL